MKLKEKDIQKVIIDYLKYTGWYVLRMPPSIYSSQKGIPDLYAVKKGRQIWIECKSAKGKLSKYQQQVIQQLLEHSAEVYVFDSIDTALETLQKINRNIRAE